MRDMPGRKAPGGIFIVFEGKEISVLREGRGEDMVFLHGYQIGRAHV